MEAPEADKARKEDIKTHPLGMKSSGVEPMTHQGLAVSMMKLPSLTS